MEILTWAVSNWEVLAGIATFVLAWNKDKVMYKLNIKQKEVDVNKAKRDVDSVYISNSEKLVELYSKSMDELTAKHKAEISEIRTEHALNIKEFREEARLMSQVNDNTRTENRTLHETVEKLERQVSKLEKIIDKLGRKLKFYEENSGIELPKDLQG